MSDNKREEIQKEAEANLHKLIKAINEKPDNYEAYYELSSLLIKLQNFTQAEELLMKALGMFADTNKKAKDLLTYGLGNVYYSAGEYEKAIKQFTEVKDKELKTDSYIMMAQSYIAKSDYKRALVFLLTAKDYRKQDPEINQMLGESLLALGDFKQSAEFYDQILNYDPNNGKANFDRGLVAMVLGEHYANYFSKAEKYDKDNYDRKQSRIQDIEKLMKDKQDKES
ncbi:tetratricopeptide repeat protein [Lactobacillus sp. S2-2]|uniref:tetratricopeptide repeat protein n=1 Tax=Lactobacillus sp. S2-2 TaxID=2692917 RepID=UPI001F21BD8D|nr:tetratricopeptide repeat protein [Lactobacillus sp. S2-2]MCF6514872.1 tetratricopeptide repeat protein [Lactobacillus sp. S2-2]